MHIIYICLAIGLIACTEQNPNLCCTDEADCANVGLEEVKGCADGLLCRGNACIAEVCTSSSECDAAAPYCTLIPDGRCQATCTDDSQCPGFGESSEQTFCEGGACVACRAEMNDCSGSTPVCAGGECVACTRNDQCASGACDDDGSCVAPALIAYVSQTGSADGECLDSAPCNSIAFALGLMPVRPVIVIDSGTYTRNATIRLQGTRRLIGRGLTPPILRRSTNGPIITIATGVFSLEFLEITGAVGSGLEDDTGGHGIVCPMGNNASFKVVDSLVTGNMVTGIRLRKCSAEVSRSTVSGNGGAVLTTDSTLRMDASSVTNNGAGMQFDAGNYTITNNFITRNTGSGIELFLFDAETASIEFNTIVDNGQVGFVCNSVAKPMANNLIARNATQVGGGCSFPNSVITDGVAALNFVSPDAAPFDYHIQAGSIAVDAATITTLDHDFDGEPRTSNAADVGADELP